MKKMLLGAVGLSALLASCGSGTAPDGSGSGRVTAVQTEYRLNSETGPFVACDNVNNVVASTQVSVYFNVSGNVQTVDVGLRGNSTSQYDGNYNAQATGQQLAAVGNGSYRLTFDANPATGGFLPQSIIVSPVRDKVKVVSATSQQAGSFHAALSVNTGSATYSFNSRLIANGNVEVYPSCTVVRTTNEDV
ncbi:hypothetical protein [Deinococcus aestuarii]|uniref:hypothetical protein n=1 Tax=Deinococcus aestuarii TaxID=2774531 RepID=UPI001FE970AB|nr:hypothetical protein [Deinococcus aestuarii]